MKITDPIVALGAGVAVTVALIGASLGVSEFHHLTGSGTGKSALVSATTAPRAPRPASPVATRPTPAPPAESAPPVTTAPATPALSTPSAAPAKPAGPSSVPVGSTLPVTPPVVPAGELLAVPGTAHLGGGAAEWSASATMNSAATVSGHNTGVTAAWQLLWDKSNLYLRATVHDPQIVQPFTHDPGQLFRGDSVSLELGARADQLSDTATLRSGDSHYLFGPKPGGGLVTAVNHSRAGTFVNGSADSRVQAIERPVSSGYLVQIAIPWSVIGVTPGSGQVLAANLNVSDGSRTGVLRDMKSTNPRRSSSNQSHPGTWQQLKLEG